MADTRDCDKCGLRKGCSQVVWGAGQRGARLFVVAENPGSEEDLMGEPMVSREGVLFNSLLAEAGIPADQCYTTYALKCQPATVPTKSEINTCLKWLWQELKVVEPKVVLTLGKLPTRLLLKQKASFWFAGFTGRIIPVEYMTAPVAVWHPPQTILSRGREANAVTVGFLKQVWEKCGD